MEEKTEMRARFNGMLDEAKSICILGHIGPDGDCLGSTLALWNYVKARGRAAGTEKKVQVYLEEFSSKFNYLPGAAEICSDKQAEGSFELCVVCDCADEGRLGPFARFYRSASHSFCIDHHATNAGFAEAAVIKPEASSTCEVLFDLMEPEYIDRDVAECVYTGLVHDTGVFRYSSTSPHTMEIAGKCMAYGFDFGSIIDDSFFAMSLPQKQVLGRVLMEMEAHLGGRLVASAINRKTMEFYGVTGKEMDGMIDELRTTRGAVCAVFQYQTLNRQFKISLRSNSDQLNVAAIAQQFGGGGHVKAAGCFMGMNPKENLKKIIAEVEKQIG